MDDPELESEVAEEEVKQDKRRIIAKETKKRVTCP